MLHAENAHVVAQPVRAIEGEQIAGTLSVKALMRGESMALLEVRMQAGVVSPFHSHFHESVIYVVSGELRTTIGQETFVLGPGDVCRHPSAVSHQVAALKEAVFIEIKSPAPELQGVLGLANEEP